VGVECSECYRGFQSARSEGIADHSDRNAHEQQVDADTQRVAGPDDWLAVVARTAAADANAPIELLGEYLNILADAILPGRRPEERELAAVRRLGRRAAEQGVDANQAVDLYLSAAWRLWQEIPMSCDLGTARRCGQLRKLCCA
jgi:hypothetical protein